MASRNLICNANAALTGAATFALTETGAGATALIRSATLTTMAAATSLTSPTFTITNTDVVDGVMLWIRNTNASPTGTFKVDLQLGGVSQTTCTVNKTDLPASSGASPSPIFFKFGSTHTGGGLTTYTLVLTTTGTQTISINNQSATANDWTRAIRRTTAGTAAVTDDLYICGEWTAAATVTTRTVTMDQTATTAYGSGVLNTTSAAGGGIHIGSSGVLTYGTTASTNYVLRVNGDVNVWAGGTWNQGTSGTPIPSTSTAVLEFVQNTLDGDFGFIANDNSTINIYGVPRTAGKSIVSCKLNADASVGATSLTVDTDTGWLSGDQIAVASTTRTAAQCETGTLSGNATATTMAVTNFIIAAAANAVPPASAAALINAHSGTSPTQAEVILLTRNVKIRSTSTTLMTYVSLLNATVNIQWCQFYYLGANVTGKKGLSFNTVNAQTNSMSVTFSSVHDCKNFGVAVESANIALLTFSSNAMWNLATTTGPACQTATAITATSLTFDSNIFIRNLAGNGWTLNDVGGTFTNNTVVGAASNGIQLSESATIGTMSGNVAHSCVSVGMNFNTAGTTGTVSAAKLWRNTGTGVTIISVVSDLIFDTPTIFGNTTHNMLVAAAFDITIKSPVISGDSTFSTTSGITFSSFAVGGKLLIDNGDLSTVTGIKTAHTQDINVSVGGVPLSAVLRNTKLGAAIEVATPSNLSNNGFVASEKHDATSANHMTWMRNGKVQTDATTFHTAAPSMLMTPTSATLKLESAPLFQGIKVAVASGATTTVGVYINKSASYNGNQPRLIQRANPALGQNSDVVLATYSAGTGSWNQLSAASSTAGDDGAWEFIVDCDGTAGAINVDDWSAA